MKKSIKLLSHLLLLSLAFVTITVAAAQDFPQTPIQALTPGKLCDKPDRYRYPEGIAYCERDVSYQTKENVIAEYDMKYGFRIKSMPREDFKIDHFIPLCMGGSNDPSNLWPQHRSVWERTDPVEPLICEKMLQGKIKQKDAVNLVIQLKTNPDTFSQVRRYVQRL